MARRSRRTAEAKATEKEKVVEAADELEIPYLDDKTAKLLIEELGEEVAAIFAEAEELDAELIDEYSDDMSEELLEALNSELDEDPPEVEEEEEMSAADKRRALRKKNKAKRMQASAKPDTKEAKEPVEKRQSRADKMKEEGAVIVEDIGLLFQAMDKDTSLILRKLTKSTWALMSISTVEVANKTGGRRKKVSVDKLKSAAYEEFRSDFPASFEDRIKYAKSKYGVEIDKKLPNGKDNPWVSKTIAGQPVAESMQKMRITQACRLQAGVHKYVEEARDRKVRSAVLHGDIPLSDVVDVVEETSEE